MEEEIEQPSENLYDFSVEEKNYSKGSFRRLQKLRIDGIAFGIDIPTLEYDLIKPEKRRKSFTVFGILSSIILGAAIFLCTLLALSAIPPVLTAIGDVSAVDSEPIISVLTLGLSTLFTGVMSIFMWLILITFAAILICIIASLTKVVITFFNLQRCSIQEMAVGYESRELIGNTIFMLVISTLCTGLLTYGFFVAKAAIPAFIIILYIAVILTMAYTISILVCVFKEKKKAKVQFNELPQEQQDSFRDHNNAIYRVKSRIKRMRDKTTDLTNNWYFY